MIVVMSCVFAFRCFVQGLPFFGIKPVIVNDKNEELHGPCEGYLVGLLFGVFPEAGTIHTHVCLLSLHASKPVRLTISASVGMSPPSRIEALKSSS